jgi:hypothetical protein
MLRHSAAVTAKNYIICTDCVDHVDHGMQPFYSRDPGTWEDQQHLWLGTKHIFVVCTDYQFLCLIMLIVCSISSHAHSDTRMLLHMEDAVYTRNASA